MADLFDANIVIFFDSYALKHDYLPKSCIFIAFRPKWRLFSLHFLPERRLSDKHHSPSLQLQTFGLRRQTAALKVVGSRGMQCLFLV